ncbi:MAG: glycogen/starch synthase [Bacteroidales bacterium]|nr:glycogen/starch synthase [Bacteroidales bacterium]
MAETLKKVLFVNTEIYPYLPESAIANIGRALPQGIQERKKEIRAFMPRFGCINERKNQLHEVIRLSGMNIVVGDVDRPLVIKVASIPAARIQVYFIDNEDYFKRKAIFSDADGRFFSDNDERAIFFAKGVLETVKKLRWAPDIIHCHGWMSALVPAYLKMVFRDDPIFSSSKVVLSLYNDIPGAKFSSDFAAKAATAGLKAEVLPISAASDGIKLAETAAKYSDAVIFGSPDIDASLAQYCKSLGIPVLPYNAGSFADGSYMDEYNALYDKLL